MLSLPREKVLADTRDRLDILYQGFCILVGYFDQTDEEIEKNNKRLRNPLNWIFILLAAYYLFTNIELITLQINIMKRMKWIKEEHHNLTVLYVAYLEK